MTLWSTSFTYDVVQPRPSTSSVLLVSFLPCMSFVFYSVSSVIAFLLSFYSCTRALEPYIRVIQAHARKPVVELTIAGRGPKNLFPYGFHFMSHVPVRTQELRTPCSERNIGIMNNSKSNMANVAPSTCTFWPRRTDRRIKTTRCG